MQCHYFPAYEIVSNAGREAFEEDGRHVKRSMVETIVDLFIESAFDGVLEKSSEHTSPPAA
jgi:hypothetical protein